MNYFTYFIRAVITDSQVFFDLVELDNTTSKVAAAEVAVGESSAHKNVGLGKLPSEIKNPRTHCTRVHGLARVWEEYLGYLEGTWSGGEGVIGRLQGKHFGQFKSGQLRRWQRRVMQWRGHQSKKIHLAQVHRPGDRA